MHPSPEDIAQKGSLIYGLSIRLAPPRPESLTISGHAFQIASHGSNQDIWLDKAQCEELPARRMIPGLQFWTGLYPPPGCWLRLR